MQVMSSDILELIAIWLVPGLLAIVLHEIAHGWMALRLGDTTARDAHRLSLNPFRHVDLMGTLLLPALMLFAKLPFVFGWAKPVPVNFERLKGGRWGGFLVALAGPMANFLMLLAWRVAAWGLQAQMEDLKPLPDVAVSMIQDVVLAGMVINLALIVFNLIPLPPLDGGRIVGALLPEKLRRPYMRLERYGLVILLVLIATGAFRHVFDPLVEFFVDML